MRGQGDGQQTDLVWGSIFPEYVHDLVMCPSKRRICNRMRDPKAPCTWGVGHAKML